MKKEKITGVILAGGKNSRMGSDKGLLEVGGKKIIVHIIEELKQVADEIIIISNGTHYDFLGYKVYRDIFEDCGPIGGIHAALTSSKTEKNLIVSCDMPFISKNIFKKIIGNSKGFEVIIPEWGNGMIEPLCAIYSRSCADAFEKMIRKGEYKLRDSFKLFNVKKINFTKNKLSGNEFLNLNTPEEYQKIVK